MPDESPENPFAAPTTADASSVAVQRRIKAPVAASAVLGFVGVCFLLLLNTNWFNNMLAFLACLSLSGILWYRFFLLSKDNDGRRLALIVTAGHVALLIAFSTTLPERFRRQKQMHDVIEKLREKHRARNSPRATSRTEGKCATRNEQQSIWGQTPI